MRVKRFLGGLWFFVASIGNASQWEIVTDINSGTISVDMSSFTRTGSIISFWEKTDFMSPKTVGGVDGTVATIKAVRLFDCAKRMTKQGRLIGLDPRGVSVFDDPNLSARWGFMPPRSKGETLMVKMCVKAGLPPPPAPLFENPVNN